MVGCEFFSTVRTYCIKQYVSWHWVWKYFVFEFPLELWLLFPDGRRWGIKLLVPAKTSQASMQGCDISLPDSSLTHILWLQQTGPGGMFAVRTLIHNKVRWVRIPLVTQWRPFLLLLPWSLHWRFASMFSAGLIGQQNNKRTKPQPSTWK